MNCFPGIFQEFCLLFRSTYLKEHLWVVASAYLNREASQGSIYFPGKYYSLRDIKCENTILQNIPRGVPISWKEYSWTCIKYWESSYFPVNNYWLVLFSGEYLLTVTRGCSGSFQPVLVWYGMFRVALVFQISTLQNVLVCKFIKNELHVLFYYEVGTVLMYCK